MERLRDVSKFVVASALIGGATQGCESFADEPPEDIYISSCSSAAYYELYDSGSAENSTVVTLQTQDDIILSPEEVEEENSTFALDSSVFPEDDLPVALDDLPQYLVDVIESETRNVDSFLPEGNAIAEVDIYKPRRETTAILNGSPTVNDDGENMIKLYVMPESDILLRDLRKVIFHEGMHIASSDLKIGRDEEWMRELERFWDILDENQDRIVSDVQDDLEERDHSDSNFEMQYLTGKIHVLGDLFNLVTESCYTGTGGHPSTGPSELFASTATVMKFYPESYRETVQNLPEKQRKIMEDLSRFVLDRLAELSPTEDLLIKQFDTELLEYLGY
jgi:mRNA-degrading endonuclease RelE of RelBE toxin-antitoxin system